MRDLYTVRLLEIPAALSVVELLTILGQIFNDPPRPNPDSGPCVDIIARPLAFGREGCRHLDDTL